MNSPSYTDQAGFPFSTKVEGLTVEERIHEFIKLLEYPEIQEALNKRFEMYLQSMGIVKAVSNAHARLDLIEEHLGADDDYCIVKDLEYGEREPRMKIPEQIAVLAASINDGCKTSEVVMVAGNVPEIRARLLKEKLASATKVTEKFMTSPEVADFLLNDVPDEYKACSKSAASKAAFDVMKKALEMFPDELREARAKKRRAKVIEYIENMDF